MDRVLAEQVAELLEQCAAGVIEPVTALKRWPDSERIVDKVLVAAWHDVNHFAADADIRKRDAAYDAYQRELLKKRAHAIRRRWLG